MFLRVVSTEAKVEYKDRSHKYLHLSDIVTVDHKNEYHDHKEDN